jgi:hypothetical protein
MTGDISNILPASVLVVSDPAFGLGDSEEQNVGTT